jgi:hypothetical protein
VAILIASENLMEGATDMPATVLVDDLDIMERDHVLDAAVAFTPWELLALDPEPALDELVPPLDIEER